MSIGNTIGNRAKGPGPGRLGFGLGGNLGGVGGGGERGNFMYFKYNFSLDTAKRMLKTFVHTHFSIRVLWLR